MTSENKNTAIARPAFCTDSHIVYLNGLRESGTINMMEAPKYIVRAYHVTNDEAIAIFKYWMETFMNNDEQNKTTNEETAMTESTNNQTQQEIESTNNQTQQETKLELNPLPNMLLSRIRIASDELEEAQQIADMDSKTFDAESDIEVDADLIEIKRLVIVNGEIDELYIDNDSISLESEYDEHIVLKQDAFRTMTEKMENANRQIDDLREIAMSLQNVLDGKVVIDVEEYKQLLEMRDAAKALFAIVGEM